MFKIDTLTDLKVEQNYNEFLVKNDNTIKDDSGRSFEVALNQSISNNQTQKKEENYDNAEIRFSFSDDKEETKSAKNDEINKNVDGENGSSSKKNFNINEKVKFLSDLLEKTFKKEETKSTGEKNTLSEKQKKGKNDDYVVISINIPKDLFSSTDLSKLKSTKDEDGKGLKLNLKELPSGAKEKIQSVLNDLKDGKIDIGRAKEAIINVLDLKSKDLKDQNSSKAKVEFNDKFLKKAVGSNDNILTQVEKIDKKDLFTLDKLFETDSESKVKDDKQLSQKELKKVDTKKAIEAEAAKEVEVNKNDFKSEIKIDLNLSKSADVGGKERADSPVAKAMNENRSMIFDTVAKNTKIVLAGNETSFSTMIRPEAIGRVDFKFTIKDGKLDGRIILQNQEAADFFKANVEELRAVFQKSNIEFGKLDINLAGHSFANGEKQSRQQENVKDYTESITKIGNKFSFASKAFESNIDPVVEIGTPINIII